MRSNDSPQKRRTFIKRAVGAGALAAGATAFTGSGSAANQSSGSIVVQGEQDGTDYKISTQGVQLDRSSTAEESEDFAYGSVAQGTVDEYEENNYSAKGQDAYHPDGALRLVEVDGEAIVQALDADYPQIEAMPQSVDITITGNGSYALGWWAKGKASGGDVEPQNQDCYPMAATSTSIVVSCIYEREGVVTGEVEVNGSNREVEFAVGNMSGNEDTYHVEGGSGGGTPSYVYLDGNVRVWIEEV